MSKKTFSIPTTVEAQIRTRARNLPIHQCYINKDWEKSQMANIIITRKHTNGNITMGNYLVDLRLLGVKDCMYRFNESPLRLDEMLKRDSEMLEECDYALVHNIIYAGFEFAEDYGFAPHKNFKTAQYILEEDVDDIPMMEIPLGDEGIPVLEVRYGETGQREMAILDAITDDYRVVYLDKDGNPEIQERTYMEIFQEIVETGMDDYYDKHGGPKSNREAQVMIDIAYLGKGYTAEEKVQIDNEFDDFIKDFKRLVDTGDEPYVDYGEELDQAYTYFDEEKTELASIAFREVIDRHPDDPLLWDLFLYNLSIDNDCVDEETVKEAYSRFPTHPVIKAWYAEWLVQEDRSDEVFSLFGNTPGLDALTTDNNSSINANAFSSFCFAYAGAWLQKGDILRAEPYYQVIVRLGINFRIGEYIQQKMTYLKREKLRELYSTELLEFND